MKSIYFSPNVHVQTFARNQRLSIIYFMLFILYLRSVLVLLLLLILLGHVFDFNHRYFMKCGLFWSSISLCFLPLLWIEYLLCTKTPIPTQAPGSVINDTTTSQQPDTILSPATTRDGTGRKKLV